MKAISPRIHPLATALLAALFLPAALPAQTATTDPVGFITLNIAGTGGTAANALSFKGLGLTQPVVYQGNAETANATTLIDDQATWTEGQFNGANGTHYVEIIRPVGVSTPVPGEGTIYDITATNASTKTLSLLQPLAVGVTSGANFRIRKHWTFSSVFGTGAAVTLSPGSATTADQVLLYNGTSYETYYYNNVSNVFIQPGWRKSGAGNVDQANTVIYPDDGILINRFQSGPASVVLLGAVKTGATQVPLVSGLNIVSNVYAADMTLSSSGLYTGNAATGVAPGSATTADQVLIYNGTTYEAYYYNNVSNVFITPGWRKSGAGNADQAAITIPVGSSVIITRTGAAFTWMAPQHPASL